MRLDPHDREALVRHAASRECGSCFAYFDPGLLGELERGRLDLTVEQAREVEVALLDCGSLDELRQRVTDHLREIGE